MENKNQSMGKRDLILIAVIVAVVCGLFLVKNFLYSAPAAVVEVSIINENSEKEVLVTFDLSESIDYVIKTADDGINHLHIQNGEAWISEANCPNHDCVKKGKISQNGEMLVCIPHRLTVSILGE